MFAVVTKDEESGIMRSFVDRITFRHPTVEIRRVLGSSFALIRARRLNSVSDWSKICDMTGAECRELVLAQGLSIPAQQHRARIFKGQRFALCMAQNAALSLMEQCRLPLYRRVAGIIDPVGNARGTALELIHQCTAVKVVTHPRYQPGYEALAEKLMYEYGTPLILCRCIEELSDCAVVIAAQDCSMQGISLRCPVLGAGSVMDAGDTPVVHSLFSQVPPEIEQVIPEGVLPMLFLAALYELNIEESVANLTVCSGKIGDVVMEITEIANIINNLL